jgi:Fe2+ or Zn2+ uptake regulation protein
MKHLGQDEIRHGQRLTALELIINEADASNKEYTKPELLEKLKDAGFQISIPTLYTDLKDLATSDPFIQDLASKNYSSIMHRSFKRYNKIFDLAMLIHDSKNQLTRHITRDTDKGTYEETVTDDSGTIKLNALNTAKAAQDSIRLMVNGENLRISSSKWQAVTKQQEATIKQLNEKLKAYSEIKPTTTTD